MRMKIEHDRPKREGVLPEPIVTFVFKQEEGKPVGRPRLTRKGYRTREPRL